MGDNTIETTFEKLLNRAPSATEKVYLYRIKDALNIKDDDPMWQIFIAQGHHIYFFVSLVNDLDAVRKKHIEDLNLKTQQLRESVQKYAKDQAKITAKKVSSDAFDKYLEQFDLKIIELVEAARIAEENRNTFRASDYLVVLFSTFFIGGLALIAGVWVGTVHPEFFGVVS